MWIYSHVDINGITSFRMPVEEQLALPASDFEMQFKSD